MKIDFDKKLKEREDYGKRMEGFSYLCYKCSTILTEAPRKPWVEKIRGKIFSIVYYWICPNCKTWTRIVKKTP